jgi:hypothetical protein
MNRIYVTLQPQREVLCDKDGNYIKDLNGNHIYHITSYLGYAAEYNLNKDTCNTKNRKQDVWANLVYQNGVLYRQAGYDYANRCWSLKPVTSDDAP